MAGASGKKLRGAGARRKITSPAAQVKDGGHGRPPHPTRVLPGQTYWPRAPRTRRLPFVVIRVGGDGRVLAKRDDESGDRLTLSEARLLARRSDGQGRYYSFLKWGARRYETWGVVVAVNPPNAMLVLPEWHPARAVSFPARLLPVGAGTAGEWITAGANLSQPTGAALQLSPRGRCEKPEGLPAVMWRPPQEALNPPLRPFGRGCGDIVLEQVASSAAHEFFVSERPAVAFGARVYLAVNRQVVGFRLLAATRNSPNGLGLICEQEVTPLGRSIALAGGCCQGAWRWRWWPREDELLVAVDDVLERGDRRLGRTP